MLIGKTNSLVEYAEALAAKEFGSTETLVEATAIAA
jgi:hypothetical protein